jgi:hypothetical protein
MMLSVISRSGASRCGIALAEQPQRVGKSTAPDRVWSGSTSPWMIGSGR